MTSWLFKTIINMTVRRIAVGATAFFLTCSALANPVVDNVAAGQVTIEQTPSTTTVNQASQKAIINWQSFNIGQQEATHFQQPAGGMALNRISPSQGASQIYGRLTATGQIILINPAGIYFGPSAFVNVGGLIATTANITDANFLSGNFQFNKVDPYSGAIINEGTIIAAQHGLVALVAPSVVNNGMIQAEMGKVVLASGNAFTMSFDGNGLVNFVVDAATTSAGTDKNGVKLSDGVHNTGTLIADGGTVMVTGKAAAGVLDHIINMEGVAQAHSVMEQNGEIILSADTDEANNNVIRLAGALDASGKTAGLVGGNVTVTSKYILADAGTNIDVSGDIGGGNVWIGGNYQGKGPLPNATAVAMLPNASINANAITSGKGGQIILWSNDYTNVAGNISARGGAQSGNGGFVETSSHNVLSVGDLHVDASAPAGAMGTWLLDPFDVTINTTSTTNGSFDGGSPTNTFTPNANSATVLNTTINTNLASANVTITTGASGSQNGDINVAGPITWTSTNTLSLVAARNITFFSAISGVNGSLNLTAANTVNSITTTSGGTINVANFNLLQGRWSQLAGTGNLFGSSLPTFSVTNNFQIASGDLNPSSVEFLRASGGAGTTPSPYTIEDVYGLQGINSSSSLRGNAFKLNANIDASSTSTWNSANSDKGFIPIGYSTNTSTTNNTEFVGTFNGQGYVIRNLYESQIGSGYNAGLFGAVAGSSSITNVGLENVNVTGRYDVGALAGNIIGNGTVTLNNNWSSGTVSINYPGSGYSAIGGLLGVILGVGTFNVGSAAPVAGGYSTATVNGGSSSAGGFVGYAQGGTVSFVQAYASGAVSGSSTGGFLGGTAAANPTFTNVFWDTQTTGQATSVLSSGAAGYKGMTTAEMQTLANFTTPANGFVAAATTWSITATPSTNSTRPSGQWFIFNGSTRPMLLSENITSVGSAHALQLIGATLGGAYTLSNDINLSSGMTNKAEVWGTNRNTPTGGGFVPISGNGNAFTGSLNGATYTISNLYENAGTTNINVGLFNHISGSTISNLTIANASLTNASTAGFSMGTLAGYTAGADSITNVLISNPIITYSAAQASAMNVGGLTGLTNASTTVSQSAVQGGTININITGGAGFPFYMGGLVGVSNGTISNSYSTASVIETGSIGTPNTNVNVGGLVGRFAAGTITNSYAAGYVSSGAGGLVGGLVGNNVAGTFAASYYNSDTSGTGTGATGGVGAGTNTNVTAETTNALMSAAIGSAGIYSTWSTSFWSIIANKSFPYINTIYTSTPRAVSATVTSSAANLQTYLAANGTNVDTGVYTGANGFAYFLEKNGTIADSSAVLLYLNDATYQANYVTLVPTSGGSASPGTVAAYGVVLDTQNGGVSNATLATAQGALSGSTILYSHDGSNNISINSGGYSFNVTGNNTYTFNTNVTSPAGGTNFSSPISITAPVTLTTTAGGTISGAISGSSNLSLSSSNTINVTGNNSSYSGSISINGGTLDLQHNQGLGTGITTINGGAFLDLDFAGTTSVASIFVLSNNAILENVNSGTVTLSGDITANTSTNSPLIVALFGDLTLDGGTITNNTTNAHPLDLIPVQNRTMTVNDNITGAGAIDGPSSEGSFGTLILAGTNTYTGNTSISASGGTLRLASAGAIGNGTNNSTAVSVISGATLNISAGTTLLNTTSPITLNGTGVGNNGALTFTNTGNIVSNPISLGTNPVNIGGTGSGTLGGVISGSGNGLTMVGSGTITLSGANTYTGATTINSGVLSVSTLANGGTASGIGASTNAAGNLVLGGGTLQYTGATTSTNRNFTLTAGTTNTFDITSGAATLTISGASTATTGALTKIGSGILALTGSNLYTGATTINAGTLSANTLANGGSGSSIGASTNAAGNLVLGGGTLQYTGSTVSTDRNFTLTAATTSSIDVSTGATNLTISGAAASTSGALTKIGSGTLILSGTNAYTGTTTINAGTLRLGASNVISNSSGITLADVSGAIFDLNGNSDTVGTLQGGGSNGGNITLGSGTLTVTQGSNQTYAGVISGVGGSFTLAGGNTLTLSGVNTYTGTTTINSDGSTLKNGANGTLPSGTTINFASGAGFGHYNLNGFTQTVTNITEAAIDSGDTVSLGSGGTLTLSNPSGTVGTSYSGTGTFNKQGAGTYTIDGNQGVFGFTGTANVTAGTLGLTNDSGTNTVDMNISGGATLAITGSTGTTIGALSGAGNVTIGNSLSLDIGNSNNGTFSGVISGTSSSISKLGSGTQTLSGANTYTGVTTISQGILSINTLTNFSGGASSLGNPSSGAISIAGAGTLQFAGSSNASSNRSIALSGSGATIDASGTSGATFTVSGGVTGTATNLNLIGSGVGTIGGAIATTSGTLTKNGAGSWTLSATNTYTGGTTINNGTLVANNVQALGPSGSGASGTTAITPSGSSTAILDLTNIASLTNNSPINFDSSASSSAAKLNTNVGISLGNNIGLTGTSNTFAVSANTTTLTGRITGTGSLTKTCGNSTCGTLTINNSLDNNNYSGGTNLINGTLIASTTNALGTNTISITPIASAVAQLDLSSLTLFSNNAITMDSSNSSSVTQLATSATISLTNNITLTGTNNNFINNSSTTTTLTGTITGTGTLISGTSGTLNINPTSNNNTYSGGTTINFGTLKASTSKALGTSGNITIAAATEASTLILDLTALTSFGDSTTRSIVFNSDASSTAQLNTSAALSFDNATGLSLTGPNNVINVAANTTSIGGTISGSGGVTKNGAGTLTLSNASNSYSGATTINAGVLSASTLANGGSNSNIGSSSNAAANLVLGGGTLQYTGATTSTNRNFTLTAGTTNTFDITSGAATLTISGASTATTGALTKIGSGTLALSGANAYTGTTTINAGTLQLGASNVISDSSAVTLANVAGAIFDVNGNTDTVGTLSGGGGTGGNISLGAGTLTVTQGSNQTYAGVISGSSGNFTKAGGNTLTLSGGNTYTGTTTINAGTLRLGANDIIANNSAVSLANVSGATLDLNSFSDTVGTLSGGGVTGGNISLGAGTLTVTQGSDQTYAGVINGSGGLTKAGANALILSNTNTYTGTTTINAGTLQLGASNVISDSSAVTLANVAGAIFDLNGNSDTVATLSGGGGTGGNISLGAGTLTVTQGSDQTYAGVISGSGGGFTKAGANTLTLSGTNTYTGITTINAGTLQLGASNVIADSSAVTFANVAGAILNLNGNSDTVGTLSGGGTTGGNISLGAGTLTVTQGSNATYAGVISGSGGFTKAGGNTLTLSGGNTYTGTTTVNAGTLRLGANDVIANNSTVSLANVSGATLDLDSWSDTIGTLLGGGVTGGNISLGAGTLTVTQGSDQTYAGVISGSGGLTKAGANALTLSNTNTYTGTTTINAGTLQLGASNVISDSSAVTLANVASAIFNLNGNSDTVGTLSGGGVTGGNIALGAGTLTVTQGSDQTYAGVISGSGGGFTKAGANVLTLSNTNTYTGTTTINAGTLQLGASNVIADSSAVTLANVAGAIFDVNGNTDTVGTLSGGGGTGGNISLGAGALTVTQGSDQTYAGVISGSGGGFTKAGANTLTLSGTNTYTGATTINAGILSVGSLANGGSNSNIGASTNAAANLVLGGGTLQYTGATTSTNRNFTLTAGTTNSFDITSGAATLTISGASTATTGALTKIGSGTLTLSGTNAYTGATTINAGTLQLGASNVISDSSAIVLANVASAVLDLNGNSDTISTLSGGGTTGGNISLGAGTLTVTQGSDQTYAGVISGSGGLTKAGANALILSGTNTYTGTTTISAGTLRLGASNIIADSSAVTLADVAGAVLDLNGNSDTVATLSGGGTTGGNITLGAGTLTVTQGSNATYAGVISGSGGFTKAGSNTLTLSGTNTYTGTTTINAGTLRLGANDIFANGSNITLANVSGAILDFDSFSDTIATLSGGSASGISLGAGTFTVTQGSDQTYAGVISGSGGLIKAGASMLTLSGTNTYTGATTINAGTLQLGAANVIADSSAVTLANVAGVVFDLNGNSDTIGTLSGGGASGGNITLGAGTLTATQGSDQTYAGVISGTGGLTKAGSSQLTLSNANTYSGTTTINAGTLQISNAQGLGTTAGGTTINSGTLAINNLTIGNEAVSMNNGTLTGSGAAILNGAVTLVASSSNIMQAGSGSTLTLGGNINGAGSLTLQGGDGVTVNGSIGNSTAISSLTTSTPTTFGSSITTTNGQTFGSGVTLAGNATFTSNTGAIAFNNALDGTFNLTLSSSGATTFTGVVGGGTSLNSLTVDASGINVNGGAVTTVGSQVYNANIALGAATTFTNTGTGAVTMSLNNGISGNKNIILTGGNSANTSFTLGGTFATNNITINGGASGTNALTVNSSSNENWTVSSANGGALAGVSGVGGTFNFNNIPSLTGGSGNDSFTLSNGTLAGSINGGSGTNTVTADNVSNTWNLSGTNAASSITGVTNGFSNIQNLVGGNAGNNFIFANNAMITGSINGTNLASTNKLDFSAYTSTMTANLSAINSGIMKNNAGNAIADYSNITNLIGSNNGNPITTDAGVNNILYLPSGKHLSDVTYTDAPINRQGVIGDPIIFNFFNLTDLAPPAPTSTSTSSTSTTSTSMNSSVAQVVQQPSTTAASNANAAVNSTPTWVMTDAALSQNITTITSQASQTFDADLEKIKINPYCMATN